jgi:hypothetical protein
VTLTAPLVVLLVAGVVVDLVTLTGATWSTWSAVRSYANARDAGVTNGRLIAARANVWRTCALTLVVLLLAGIGTARLLSVDAVVTRTSFVLFSLLLLAQVTVALIVVVDVSERTALRRRYRADPTSPSIVGSDVQEAPR